MRLKPLVEPERAAKALRQQAEYARQAVNAMGTDALVNAYVSWAHDTERQLGALFAEPDLDALFTARFWHISQFGVEMPRLPEAVRSETDLQAQRLETAADELAGLVKRLAGDGDATIAVVDTNVFLHCRPLEEFDWSFVAPTVRIVVPVRVIEELDNRRRDRSAEIGDRARGSVRWLRQVLLPAAGGPATLREGLTIESLILDGQRELYVSADTEILEAAATLEQFARRPVAIITLDLGMQLRGLTYRGRSTGFRVLLVPDHYMRGVVTPSGDA